MPIASLAPEAIAGLPAWVPEPVRLYLSHTSAGVSLRGAARQKGVHPSTVMRQVHRLESRRDDPLTDEAIERLANALTQVGPPAANKETDEMMHIRLRVPALYDEATIAREARRILRRLCESHAVLAVAPDMEKAIVLRNTGVGPGTRTAVLPRAVAEAFVLKDWISCASKGRVSTYAITDAGRAALKRLIAEEQSERRASGFNEAPCRFGEQHRDWSERSVTDPGSNQRRRQRYNLAESPLTALARRKDRNGAPFMTPEMVAAGERLREDFELAQMGPRITQNWEKFLTGHDGGVLAAGAGLAEGPRAARERVLAALDELGPGLADIALRCCCFLEGLEAAEKRIGWSARSGKIVLRIALDRLRRHYARTHGVHGVMIG